MKSMVENRGRWDAGFRSPLLRLFVAEVNVAGVIPEIGMYGRIYGKSVYPPHKAIAFQSGCQASLRS